jgi:hypothetical protein
MKTMKTLGIALTLAMVACGCGRGAGSSEQAKISEEPKAVETQPAEPAPGEAEHAPAGVVPGSYEDWCGEHEVPESVCTRCNPTLIPAFQATNDWCAEHGLPESQCLKCHPDLEITRPPKPQGT